MLHWRYLSEVVTHPNAVIVSSVLSAWPEGSFCLQSTETQRHTFEPVTRLCQEASFVFDFRKVPPGLLRSWCTLWRRGTGGQVGMCHGHLLATGLDKPWWLYSCWQMASVHIDTGGGGGMLVSAQINVFMTNLHSSLSAVAIWMMSIQASHSTKVRLAWDSKGERVAVIDGWAKGFSSP